jgi:hypothetical protein
MYCLRHPAKFECYGRGGPTKPGCPQPECGGKHAAGAHELLGKMDASVNFIAGGDYGSDEDEEWYANIIRVEPEGEGQQEFDDSWLELDREKQSNEEVPLEEEAASREAVRGTAAPRGAAHGGVDSGGAAKDKAAPRKAV